MRSSGKLNWKFMDLDRIDLHPGHFAVDAGGALIALARATGASRPAWGGTADLAGLAAAIPSTMPRSAAW